MAGTVKVTLNGTTLIDHSDATVAPDKVLSSYVAYEGDGDRITGNYVAPSIQSNKTTTPTTSSQTVIPDSGYDAMSQVTVNAIPSQYIIPSGTKQITQNGTEDVTQYASVNVNVAGGTQYTATFTGSKGGRVNQCYVVYNGVTYIDNTGSINFSAGDTLECYATGSESQGVSVSVNGQGTVNYGNTYSYTLPSRDITIEMSYGSESYIRINETAVVLSITENGSYNVDDYNIASVNVTKNIQPLSIVANGTYTATGSVDGYSPITVSVGGGASFEDEIIQRTISGSYTNYGISIVGNASFSECTNLSEVNMPNVTTVSSSAFYRCYSLSYANLPNCTKLQTGAFYMCYNLESIVLGSCSSIQGNAFYGCSKLTSLDLSLCPSIEFCTFYQCSKLTSVNMPQCSAIGTSAFYYCKSLTSVDYSLCEFVQASAFMGCTSLQTVSLPVCSYLSGGAFSGCIALTDVYLPSCSSTSTYVFTGCKTLPRINLPMLVGVQAYCFQTCQQLSDISIPSCEWINSAAFSNCWALSVLKLPKVSAIRSSAFYNCYNLLSLYVLSTSLCTLANANAFLNTPISTYTTSTGGVNGSVFVRESLYSSYLTATNWSLYSARIVSLTDTEIEALNS